VWVATFQQHSGRVREPKLAVWSSRRAVVDTGPVRGHTCSSGQCRACMALFSQSRPRKKDIWGGPAAAPARHLPSPLGVVRFIRPTPPRTLTHGSEPLLLAREQAVHQCYEGTLLTMRATDRKTWMAFSSAIWIIRGSFMEEARVSSRVRNRR
jgi:hypothetical protein